MTEVFPAPETQAAKTTIPSPWLEFWVDVMNAGEPPQSIADTLRTASDSDLDTIQSTLQAARARLDALYTIVIDERTRRWEASHPKS